MSFDERVITSIYDRLIDDIINIPLQTFSGRITESTTLTDAFTLNRNIVHNILDIRRGVQLQQQSVEVEVDVNNRQIDSIFFENIMGMFLDEFDVATNLGEGNNYEDVKVVLTEEQFNGLDELKCLSGVSDQSSTCSICMSDFDEDTEFLGLISLPCKHIFHKNCIKHWLCKESVKCPVCRHDCREKF
uniref:RING-type domain-containing protein n=1 Tax=viral metagenome TaxID=1070528 RepID=A0A6C0DZI0_9ZZZZ